MSSTDTAAAPLNAIRAFVEAARQLSFSRAARVLSITPSGVSHHVTALEKHLGQALFLRKGSALSLTDAGRLYFEAVHEAVATIEGATRQLTQQARQPGRLLVRTSLPTFAIHLLIPALPQFSSEQGLQVELLTSLSPPAPDDAYDVLITRDLSVDGADQWLLSDERLVCVASPARQAQSAALPVAQWPFLSARSRPEVLGLWAIAQDLTPAQLSVAASFDSLYLALPAALAGMGHLVLPRILAAGALAQGLLCEAPLPPVRTGGGYKAYINPRSAAATAATEFCRWLKLQLRAAEPSLA